MIGLFLFAVCSWAVFSAKVKDDLIGRHLLVFAAISSLGYFASGLERALFTAWILLLLLAMWESLRYVIKLARVS